MSRLRMAAPNAAPLILPALAVLATAAGFPK